MSIFRANTKYTGYRFESCLQHKLKFTTITQIQTEAEQRYPFIDGNDEHNRIATIRRFAYVNGANRNTWVSVDVPSEPYKEYLCWDSTKECICVCTRFEGLWLDDNSTERSISHYQPLPPKP